MKKTLTKKSNIHDMGEILLINGRAEMEADELQDCINYRMGVISDLKSDIANKEKSVVQVHNQIGMLEAIRKEKLKKS